MNPFNHKITRAIRQFALTLLAGFILVSCSGSSPTPIPPSGINTGLVVIASGTVDPYGGTISDTLGETAVIVQPGSVSRTETITIERGRDAEGNLVTTFLSSSPTAIPVDIVLPPEDVLENSTSDSASLVAGVITSPFVEGDTNFSECPGLNGGVDKGWFKRCSYFWKPVKAITKL